MFYVLGIVIALFGLVVLLTGSLLWGILLIALGAIIATVPASGRL